MFRGWEEAILEKVNWFCIKTRGNKENVESILRLYTMTRIELLNVHKILEIAHRRRFSAFRQDAE